MLKKTIAVTAITAALVAGVMVTPGLAAGKGGGKGNTIASTASISINQADSRLGDWVTFSTSIPSTAGNAQVAVRCYQDSAVVYAESNTPTSAFKLGGGSSDWLVVGGAALCTAELFEWKNVKTAHMEYVSYATTVFAAGDRLA